MAQRKGITVSEAAERLESTPQTVRNMIRSGQLRAKQVGLRKQIIDPASVEKYTPYFDDEE